MKLSTVFGALGGSAQILHSATNVALLVGLIYLVDCRVHASAAESIDRCYFTALPMMGIGAAGKGGFMLGYGTYNPTLRKPDELSAPDRDNHGRFSKRQP